MAVNYSLATKTARMTAVVTQIGASGLLVITNSGGSVLATFTLAATAGTVTGDVLTLSDNNGGNAGILSATASASGTAALARIQTAGAVDVITGLTVGLSASDLIVDSINVTAGQSIVINNGSITHA